MKYNIRSLLAIVTMAAVTTAAAVWTKQTYIGFSASGVSSPVANRSIWRDFRIPDSATDVSFSVTNNECRVGFAISETEFTQWCARAKWKLEPIETADVFFGPTLFDRTLDEARVVGGYHFYPPNGNGTFDSAGLRAEFWATKPPQH